MAKERNSGVFQMDNGMWGYRFTVIIDGKQISRRKTTDENGAKLTTKTAAIKARTTAIAQAHIDSKRTQEIHRRTVKDVFTEYSERGRMGKAYSTIKKQDSIWNNHICPRFGKRYVDDISIAEITD